MAEKFSNVGTNIKAIGYLAVAYFCFASLNLVSKALYEYHINPMTITFYRGLFCVFLFMPFALMMLRRGEVLNFSKINLYKGLIDFLSIPAWIMAVSNINIPEAVGLSYVTPLMTAVLAIIFLKDRFSIDKWIVMLVGLVGVYIIVKPNTDNFNYHIIYVFIACALWAAGSILTKNLTNRQHPTIIVFVTNIVIVLLALPFFISNPYLMKSNEMLLCLIMSATAGGGYYFLSKAYSYANLSNLVPYDYLRLIFATISAYIFYGQVIDINTVIGSMLIFGGAAYLIRKQLK